MENQDTHKQKENEVIKKDLSKSTVIEPKQLLDISNQEDYNYLDDFLQISSRAVFINENKAIPQKKKKVKKIIKKKMKKSDNNKKNELIKEEIKLKKNDDIKNNQKENFLFNKFNEKINKIQISNKEENIKLNNNESVKCNDKKKEIKEIDEKPDKIKKMKENNEENKNDEENKKKIIEEEKAKMLEKEKIIYEKYIHFAKLKLLLELKNHLKVIYFFLKLKNSFICCANKICANFHGYFIRENFKLNFITKKIINYRDFAASKINAYYKGYSIRKLSKKIIQKKEDSYIIYSSLSNNQMLYFKIRYMSGIKDNIYFEYCKLLKCFIYYISRKEKILSKKIIEGFFYNEKYNKLVDDMYEKNSKGENIINFPKILERNDLNIEKYDKIINEYIKAHRPVKNKRVNIIDYEEKKKKVLDDDILMSNKRLIKLNKMNRSKSMMRLKEIKNKGILKPSKSYINLRTDDKKIQFGQAKIKGYHVQKK